MDIKNPTNVLESDSGNFISIHPYEEWFFKIEPNRRKYYVVHYHDEHTHYKAWEYTNGHNVDNGWENTLCGCCRKEVPKQLKIILKLLELNL
jgi:hypothetical protein